MSLLVNGEILLYGTVGDPWGDGSGFTDKDVALALADAPVGPVVARLNSPGGIATMGMAIHTLLKARGCTIMIDGLAGSAASLIAMAGTEIIMARGSLLMIHDPATVVFGTTDDLAKASQDMEVITSSYAEVYAARSGRDIEDIRGIMRAETWFKAADAVAAGFATAVADIEAQPATAFAYDLYRAAPAALPRRVSPAQPAAAAASPKEKTMSVKNDPNIPANVPPGTAPAPSPAPAADQPKAWAHDIYLSAGKAGLTIAETNTIVAAAGSAEAAKDAIIDAVAAKQNGTLPSPNGGRTEVSADAGDKFRTGAAQALAARAGLDKRDGGNEWNGASLMSIATAIASRDGRLASRDPMKIITAAVTHSSSDFPAILENVASKALLKGYNEAPETFEEWTSVGNLSDFKIAKRADLNSFADLPLKPEGSEYVFMTTGERGEMVQLGTYGGLVSITREAVINDDLDAFSRIPRKMGLAARRTIGTAVYKTLTQNPVMSDAATLFHASHKNLITGANSALAASAAGIAALDGARSAMALQTDRSAEKVTLNIRPKYLIVPVALEGIGTQIMNSTAEPGQDNPNIGNRVARMAKVISEARLDAASTTAWYLAAGQEFDTIEVSYLNGQREPTIERDQPFMQDGVVFKVRHDFGVKALDWKTLFKSTGVAN